MQPSTMQGKHKANEGKLEERLAKMGTKIDHLISKAEAAQAEVQAKLNSLKEKEKDALHRGEEALCDLKLSLQSAWADLNVALHEIRAGATKAAHRFDKDQLEEPKSFSLKKETTHVNEFDCYFCDNCRKFIYDELKGDPKQGISPRTHADDLPGSWQCPVCGSSAAELRAVTLFDDFTNEEAAENARE